MACTLRGAALRSAMGKRAASWTAFISAFAASALALRVALNLGLFAANGESVGCDLTLQSRWAAVAALAALVSAIAQIIRRASR
jgi:hypothetical protein